MSSPKIIKIADEPSGRLVGKAAVGAYGAAALSRIAASHCELLAVMYGVDTVVVYYQRATEVFYCNSAGLVCRWAVRPDRITQGSN